MYIPSTFKQDNIDDLIAIIQQYPFATLVTHSSDGIEANHIPMLLENKNDELILKAHIAKANPLWKETQSGSKVLVIFNGPNAYISPSLYPTKAEHGKVVPTWNYVAVHAKGSISYSHDAKSIHEILDQLTTQHESTLSKPWSIFDAPEEFIGKIISAIVGVEIKLDSIVGKWKLSQNQPEVNQQGVIDGLGAMKDNDSQKISAMIKKSV